MLRVYNLNLRLLLTAHAGGAAVRALEFEGEMRAPDRMAALNAYVETLKAVLEKGEPVPRIPSPLEILQWRRGRGCDLASQGSESLVLRIKGCFDATAPQPSSQPHPAGKESGS